MNKQFLKDAVMWGILLWLIGYVLGIILFMVMPQALIGWVLTPVGIVITLWVLLTRIKKHSLSYYFFLAVAWTLIAIVFDYLFLVKIFAPSDGYYKLDVYLYYFLTFMLPITVGWKKSRT